MSIAPSEQSLQTSPHPDDTPANFARLLDYIDMMARCHSRRTGQPVHVYEDYASHLFIRTLQRYDPATGYSLLACMMMTSPLGRSARWQRRIDQRWHFGTL